MANCPNCGSDHIQIKQETDVNWGRAIAGYALFGIVGGAVGAVTGEDRNVNACLDCGTSWKAQDLYNILQVIEKYTGAKLNLARQRDRLYMNNFVSTIVPYLEIVGETDKKGEELIEKAKKEAQDKAYTGCGGFGCLFLIFALFGTASMGQYAIVGVILGIVVFIIASIIEMISMSRNEKNVEQAVESSKSKVVEMKRQVEKNLLIEVRRFMNNNPL